MKLNTYLNFGGDCEQAFRFYAQRLGGQITRVMKRGEHGNPGQHWPGWEHSIQYASLNLGRTELMGADVPPAHFQPMRSAYLSLTIDGAAETERVYTLLSDNGQVFMPMEETFFANHFAVLRDRFGTNWMLLCPKRDA